mgnify:CR=1 FL=1
MSTETAIAPPGGDAGSLKIFVKKHLREYGMLLSLIAIMIFFEIMTNGTLLKPLNLTNLILQNSYIVIMALGMLLVIVSGHIDLSVGSVAGFVGAVAAVLMVKLGVPAIAAVAICLAIGAAIGAAQGWFVAYLRIPSFIVTLAGMLVFKGLSLAVLGGASVGPFPTTFQRLSSGFIPDAFATPGLKLTSLILGTVLALGLVYLNFRNRARQQRHQTETEPYGFFVLKNIVLFSVVTYFTYLLASLRGLPNVLIIMVALIALYAFIANRTTIGRQIYAVGGNEKAAKLSGVMTERLPPEALDRAAALLRAGELVAFPTETVYGLGADARNGRAVAGIFAAKGRPSDHPLIVHVLDAAGAEPFADHLPDAARRLMDAFWPGPLTLVVPAQSTVLREVTGGQPTVALRVPQQPFTLAVIEKLGRGVVAPSANRFGRVSPTAAQHVVEEFPTLELWVADAGPTPVGVESTIVDLSRLASVGAVVLRPGAASADEIAQTFQAAGLSITVRAPVHESVKPAVVGSERADDPRVPGALPSHYAPTTPLRLWCREAYRRFVETATGAESVAHAVWFPPDWPQTPGETLRLPQPEADAAIAQQLYQALRTLDASGAQELWVALPEGDSPLLTAVRDRLRRAASR